MNTPVLFLVFNRPDTTIQVFQKIREAEPLRLYVAADGPRKDREGEAEKCKQVRHIATNVDWDCEVKTLFRDENLGCKMAVSGGIDWFFEKEEMGIILEDDCLPSKTFFRFCEELLIKYRQDTRIWHIGGTNPLSKITQADSYYFSIYNRIWGWATWKRAWKNFDSEIKIWPEIKKNKKLKYVLSKSEYIKYEKLFDSVYNGEIDTWDYQWFLIKLINGLSIIPNTNLVKNIGFGKNATHTKDINHKLANLELGEMKFPLIHSKVFHPSYENDKKWGNFNMSSRSKIINIIRNITKL